MEIRVKRVYESPSPDDGQRVLVDRLWPRGLARDAARVDLWLKDIAPSDELRRWYRHEPARWDEFRRRYFDELRNAADIVDARLSQLQGDTVTLLFGSKEPRLNNAWALLEFINARVAGKPPPK